MTQCQQQGIPTRLVPLATCNPATGYCELQSNKVVPSLELPSIVFPGEQFEAGLLVRNTSEMSQQIDKVAVHLLPPDMGAPIGPINFPLATTLGPGQRAASNLGPVTVPMDLARGLWSWTAEVYGPGLGPMSHRGGWRGSFVAIDPQAAKEDPAGDCFVSGTSMPTSCLGNDLRQLFVNVMGSVIRARVEMQDPQRNTLQSGEANKTVSLVRGGSNCTYQGFSGVGLVAELQWNPHLTARNLECVNGSLAARTDLTLAATQTGARWDMYEFKWEQPSSQDIVGRPFAAVSEVNNSRDSIFIENIPATQ